MKHCKWIHVFVEVEPLDNCSITFFFVFYPTIEMKAPYRHILTSGRNHINTSNLRFPNKLDYCLR